MINDLNQRLARVAEQRARLEKLRRQVAELETEYRQAGASAEQLRQQLIKEKRDVERLEGISLTGLLAAFFGSRDELLRRERQEAVTAQLRYDEARVRAERLGAELARAQQEIAGLGQVEAEYHRLLAEKERQMRASHGWGARQLHELEQREQSAQRHLKELDEAQRAGMEADGALARVAGSLNAAGNWGAFDILGGGWLATAAKHSRIDEAKGALYHAQEALARFRRELKDVQASLQLPEIANLDGFTRFADFFFDGLFADIYVQNRINESLRSVERSRKQVRDMLTWIGEQRRQVEADLQNVQRQKEMLVEGYQGG